MRSPRMPGYHSAFSRKGKIEFQVGHRYEGSSKIERREELILKDEKCKIIYDLGECRVAIHPRLLRSLAFASEDGVFRDA